MSEQIEQVAITALTPVATQILEDLHVAASEKIAELEKAIPPRLDAAEQDVQDWARSLLGALHGLVARIEGHRGTAASDTPPPTPAADAPPAKTAAAPAPASTTPASPAEAAK